MATFRVGVSQRRSDASIAAGVGRLLASRGTLSGSNIEQSWSIAGRISSATISHTERCARIPYVHLSVAFWSAVSESKALRSVSHAVLSSSTSDRSHNA